VNAWLFGYSPCIDSRESGPYWDWTTLILVRAMREYVGPETQLLDMGTGCIGVLSVCAQLKMGCRSVVAVDYVPQVVSMARRTCAPLGLDIDFACSDLFWKVPGRFDVIVFNAPYLDDNKARQLGLLSTDLEQRRFGGRNGETIVRFLAKASRHLSEKGVAIVGINRYHIPQEAVHEMIARSGLHLVRCMEDRWTRCAAFVLGPSPGSAAREDFSWEKKLDSG
jgi:methylase of polypeptide subunit release factors